MAETLKELMRYSRTGCIDDPDDIMDIMDRLSGLTLAEVIDLVDQTAEENVMILADVMLNEEYELELDSDMMKAFGFPELLFLIDSTKLPLEGGNFFRKREADPGLTACMKEPMRYVCMKLVHDLFRRGRETSDLFRMFSAVNIQVLFDLLEVEDLIRGQKEAKGKRFAACRKEYCEQAGFLKLDMDKNSSIEDIFSQAEKIRGCTWDPWKSVRHFEEQILTAYEIMDHLLIDPFRYLYPEKFSMEYILGKYGSWFTRESWL